MTARPEAGQRLHRLLAVLTWLARVGHAPVDDLARRFGMTPEELVADLEMAACCGLPPYTPDQLMEIVVDEQEVTANLGPELARPRRLTPSEGFALAAAARAILDTPGSDPDGALARALSKLERVLGADGRLRIDLGDSQHVAEARRSVDDKAQLLVRYYSASSDEETERVIDPWSVLSIEGRWYLDAYCHRASGLRRFRVDRFLSMERTGKPIDHEASPGQPGTGIKGGALDGEAFAIGPDAVVAKVVVDEGGHWLVEAVPILSAVSLPDGSTEIELGVTSNVWFERLLLRLGPHARVLEPPSLVNAGKDAAKRLLELYRD